MSEKENLKQILEIVKDQKLDSTELVSVPEDQKFVPSVLESLPAPIEVESTSNDIHDDYVMVRSNLRNIIDKGRDALDSMIEIAQQSEKAFAFETVAELMKTLVQVNREMIDLHRDMAKLKTEKSQPETTSTGDVNIENAVFVGSTAELNEIIKKKKLDDTF